MICEKCNEEMQHVLEDSTQGWICPICGYNILTTYLKNEDCNNTTYSIILKKNSCIDTKKIKILSHIAGVNYITAKQMLVNGNDCLLEARAYEIKEIIIQLSSANIDFEVKPFYNHL